MNGATATIDGSMQETVYMVDVDAEDMPMSNHKRVTESDIRPALSRSAPASALQQSALRR